VQEKAEDDVEFSYTAQKDSKECENQWSKGLNGCKCCFTPDRMFENAVESILALNIVGMDTLQAQKFVRLCSADIKGAMQLSKNKRRVTYLTSSMTILFTLCDSGKWPPSSVNAACFLTLRWITCRNAWMSPIQTF
jgi:hypothetical protein